MIFLRSYYIFSVRQEFMKLYHERPSSLYEMLKQIYTLNKCEIDYAFQVFSSLTDKIEKERIDQKLYLKYHHEMIYTKTKTEHIINNLYKDEVSILNIKHSYMLLTTNHSYSSFFNILLDYHDAFFVCDFKNQDYFFLNDIKVLV